MARLDDDRWYTPRESAASTTGSPSPPAAWQDTARSAGSDASNVWYDTVRSNNSDGSSNWYSPRQSPPSAAPRPPRGPPPRGPPPTHGAAQRVPPLALGAAPRAPPPSKYAPPGADVEDWRPAPPGPASSLYVQDEFTRAAESFKSARPPVQHQAPAPTHSDADVADVFSFARHNRVQDIERLLVRGVPADSRDVHGNTIAIIGAQNGHKRVVKAALRRGADVNAVNLRGNTCLHFCFAFGFTELGEYLITKGADNRVVNASGKTCYEGLG